MKRYAIIVAGGKGLRMGGEIPKQFLHLKGLPILMHTLNRFHRFDPEIELVVVLPADQQPYWNELCKQHHFLTPHQIVTGGETRFHSVSNGLEAIGNDGIVAIHDGVRPLVSGSVLQQAYETAGQTGSAIPTTPAIESLRVLAPDGTSHAVDRSLFVQVQTPQVFHTPKLKAAYRQPYRNDFTDDASVFEAAGNTVTLIPGNRENIKITQPADLTLAELLIENA